MRFLKLFVSSNRKFCGLLEKEFPNFFCAPRCYNKDQRDMLTNIIIENKKMRILEVGGVDRPFLGKSKEYYYCGMDIDYKPSCYDCYDEFFVQSVEEKIAARFDLIISSHLMEHVPNNTRSVKSMYNALNEGGLMVHYIPSKYHFYSLCLRLVGPKIQKVLIKNLRPEAIATTGYPAFFDHCSPNQMKRLCNACGFKNVEIIPYYKATDYFAFFIPAYLFVSIFENLFEFFGVSYFASGFIVRAQK